MSSLKDKGIDFEFCVLSGQEGVLDATIREKGGEVHYCKLGFGFVFQFVRLLKTEQYDVVHSHVSLVSGIILLLARFAGIGNRVSHFRSTTDVASTSLLRRLRNVVLKRLLLSHAKKILGVSYGSLNGYWKGVWENDDRFAVVYNGFNVPSIELKEGFWKTYIHDYDGGNIVVNVGRMDTPKNHMRQLSIFHQYQANNVNAWMVFIGKESATKEEMIHYSQEYGFRSRLVFLGEQADVLPFVAHSSVMLFPSLWEGLPGALIEAASVGTPVLASDIPSVKEVAKQLPIVEYMALNESDKAWAKTLQRVIDDKPDHKTAIDAFNRSDFLLDANVDRLYGIYTQ
jgi:glycosyltransferase involved in cell wall biosynthesis